MEDNLYFLQINLEDETGTEILSLVKNPAMESLWLTFSKEEAQIFFSEEKKIITGVVAIPGKVIPRLNNKKFILTKEVIEQDSIKFFKRNAIKNVNLEHSKSVNNCYVIESWLTGKVDKSHTMFGELPEGTWVVSMKIDNPEIWEKIQNNEVRGFSLEGEFEIVKASKEEDNLTKIQNLLQSYFQNK